MARNAQGGAALRAEAARTVYAVRAEGQSLDVALDAGARRVPPAELSFYKHLCFETLRHHWQLRAQLAGLLARPLHRRDALVEDLLAVGLAQLQHTRVAEHAAVSQTVEAVRLLRRPKLAGLANAVLRRYLRERPVADGDEASHNHPGWMLECLRQDWPEAWPAVAAANNERAPMWLRVHRRLALDDYAARLAAAFPGDEPPQPLAGLEQGLCLAGARAVDELPGFADGDVSVQDGAAQLAAPWLLADGGERVLDACAAPGGKTAHLSELLGPGAALTAIDSDAERLERVRETLSRVGGRATVLHADASKPGDWWDGAGFDRILLDAPCSASGVIRRHPDIRLLRRASDLPGLALRQFGLLDALWPLLAPGGRLLYVTCSVFREENDAVVARFLAGQPDAAEESLLPNNNIRDLMTRKAVGWQVLPGTRRLDGFYYASLTKSPH